MTPLPPPLGSGALVFWRLDKARYGDQWNSGDGAALAGGRWNSPGRRAIYACLDPSTAILEVAVHTSFKSLDAVAHVLTSARITDPKRIHVVTDADLPDATWLIAGGDHPERQAFGDTLLAHHAIVLLPSAISRHSWNVVMNPSAIPGLYETIRQEKFVFDPRFARASQELPTKPRR